MSVEPLKESHQNLSFQKSKNPNPSFGFLETRGICSKSKKAQNSSSFQNSKNPKIPTPVSDFWKLEEFAQNPKKPKIPRVSKIPKIQKFHPKVWIFRNSSGSLEIQKNQNSSSFQKTKNPKTPTQVSDFWKLEEFAQNPKKPKIPRVSKIPKIQKFPTPVSDFWKLEEFAQNPKKPKIPRVSKNPKLGWDFWIFGFLETRGILGFFGF